MKKTFIQRGVNAGGRIAPQPSRDGPDLGRVPKVRGDRFAIGERRFRKRGAHRMTDLKAQAQRRIAIAGSIIFGLLTLATIAAAITIWVVPRLGNQKTTRGGLAVRAPAKVRVASRFLSPSQEDAVAMVKRAVAVRHPENVAELFRLGTSNAQEVIAFLKKLEDSKITPQFTWLSSVNAGGLALEGVRVTYMGDFSMLDYLAFLTPDNSGQWKIDFDAFARVASPSWQELLEHKVEKATVRVIAERDNYFNGPFSDEQWTCFGLASAETDTLYYGYCPKGSEASQTMRKLAAAHRGRFRVTIEIAHVKDALSRQFKITQVIADDWVLVDP